MTTYNKTTLKTFFQNGDVPTGSDYSNFIDSYVNIVETSEQSIASNLVIPEVISPRVSATNINVTSILSANTMQIDRIGASAISAAVVTVTGDVSAETVYTSAARTGTLFLGSGVVSAAGTAQATAAPLTFGINTGKGVVDGQTTGFALLANRTGLVQYLFNNGASANLWPPTGGTINGLAANAAFSLATSAMVTILHIGGSAYAVK